MHRHLYLALALALLAGCATHAATSGRVVIQDRNVAAELRINARDRAFIEQYYAAKKRNGLPPGLAKRAGGLPPGLAKRDTLPPGLQSEPLPVELERGLTPLPATYVRVRIGTDVVLLERKTRVVLDVLYGVARS